METLFRPHILLESDYILYFSSALREARDIYIHLSPIKPAFDELEITELTEAEPLLKPIIHRICMLWARCSAYRKPDRIVTLFKEVSNLIINMVRLKYR